jgi:uncharacterized protein
MELGKLHKLKVIRKSQSGVYLNSQKGDPADEILMPKSQIMRTIEAGDEIEVFIYKDSENRLTATMKKPRLMVGELAVLKVIETSTIGAFLDWGLDKDLFLPFREQTYRVKKADECLVGLYIDQSNRLCATMNIYNLLINEAPYKENDRVEGTIYSINKELGAFVAVNNKYQGLIPNKELYGEYKPGDKVEIRIKRVRENGILELSLRKEAYNEIPEDAKKILDRIGLKGGMLMLNDSSMPEDIKAELNMSKAAFKRAVGRLLREGKIKMSGRGIEGI